jgi:hypothetical protein
MSVFYDHLTSVDSVRPHLAEYLTAEEIEEILEDFDEAMHHVVLEVILQETPEHVHEAFLVRFRDNPADPNHLLFLRQYAPLIDEAIRRAGENSRQLFIDAIHE